MSDQKSVTVKQPTKTRTRCAICLSNYTEFIDKLIYSGFTNDQVIDTLLKEKIDGITVKNIQGHKTYHIDKDKIDISKLEEMQTQLRDHVLTLNNNREGGLEGTLMKKASQVNEKAKDLDPNQDLEQKRQSLKAVNKRLAVKKKDLNLFGEMTYVMELNRERLENARKIEKDNQNMVLGITSKLADSHFRNAVKMHEITSGMESLQDVRLAELLTMFNNIIFSHEVSDITRFDMFRLFKRFEHTGLDPNQVPKDSTQAKEFEHAHSFASVKNETDYDKMLAEQDELPPELKRSKNEKVFVRGEAVEEYEDIEEEEIEEDKYIKDNPEEINKNNDININNNKNNSKPNNKNKTIKKKKSNQDNKKNKSATDEALDLLNQFR